MIEIIDDAIPLPYQERLKRIVTDPMLPWYYNEYTIEAERENDKFQYTHNILDICFSKMLI